jgi:hydrogenase maturation protease
MGALGGPAVVLGVGNILLRDDGAGLRVVDGLRSMVRDDPTALPEGTRLVDGGTLGLDLLRTVDDARCLLLLDAVDLGRPAGTVSVLRRDEILDAGSSWGRSVPGGVGELLGVARLMGWLPDAVAMVGIQVHDTSFGVGLSEHVAAALPDAITTARNELCGLHKLATAATPRTAGAGEAEGAMA